MNGVPGPRSLWQDALHQLAANRAAMGGGLFLLLLCILALLTPWIAPYPYEQQNLALGAAPPSVQHWFGTDVLGRDLLTRVMYGGRLSLAVGLVATLVAVLIGCSWGLVSAYFGGRVDMFMMRIVDILYALPFMIFIILLTVVFGRSMLLLFLAIGCVEWLTMARIIRTQTLAVRNREYIEAAECIGLPHRVIMLRHVLPNTAGPLVVYATLTVPNVMLLEAFLSFLGLGIQPPQSSWGLLIAHGVESMEEYPWLLLFPGAFLSLCLFSLNFLGDGLRDALDPLAARD